VKYSDPNLVDHLASAYVLGTLGSGARRRFERLRRDRADVQLAVTRWEARLGPLAQSVAAVKPSPRVWKAIEARTRPQAAAAAGWGGWLKPAGWGFGGLAAGIVAASALFFAAPGVFLTADQVAMRTGEKLPHSYVGLLTDEQGNGKVLVSSLRHGRTMTVKVIGPITPPPAGHQLVLWAVPDTGAPFPIGKVPLTGSLTSQMPDTAEKLVAKITKLMVTQETTDRPTTPGLVVFRGNCAKLW
jgi:anti-sigma-K factor RskA